MKWRMGNAKYKIRNQSAIRISSPLLKKFARNPDWCCLSRSMTQRLSRWALFLSVASVSAAQEPTPSPSASSVIKPSWETQRQAAAYLLTIPAPRGLITDRNGLPLAQTRVSYNLSIVFPTPLEFADHQVVEFVNRAVASVYGLTTRQVSFSEEAAVQHYRNRGVIPFD